MSLTNVAVPSAGESISEATVGKWFFKSGDYVEKDMAIFEIETEKATMEVNAPVSGVLAVSTETGTTVPIGKVVATIDTEAAKPANGATSATKTEAPKSQASAPTNAKATTPVAVVSNGQSNVNHDLLKGLGPSKRKAIREGKASVPSSSPSNTSLNIDDPDVVRKPMSTIRKKIAERLIHSQQSTATLTTFNEVDMTNVFSIRDKIKEEFQKKNGVKLGFMSFFAKAICHAAKEVPQVNAFIDGTDILFNQNVHLSIAVSTDRGLVVPVVRKANTLSFADIEKQIGALADKARLGKLGIEDMSGGTLTLTNGGVFGSLLSTPIINPPQSAILGMHKTEYRVMAIPDGKSFKMEIRPMMYLALSYDHRVIDGKESVTFLVKVKEFLETVKESEVN